MIVPFDRSVLTLNTKDNTINDLVKYNTLEQKLYFIFLYKYNAQERFNDRSECSISYKEIKNILKVKGKMPNTKIKKAVKQFISDRTIEVTANEKEVVIDYVNIPEEHKTHIVDLESIIKCKSINQIKILIILSSTNNKYFYRNFAAKALGLDTSDYNKTSKATDTIKRICKSLKENDIIKNFSYNAEQNKFSVKHYESQYNNEKQRVNEDNVEYLRSMFKRCV